MIRPTMSPRSAPLVLDRARYTVALPTQIKGRRIWPSLPRRSERCAYRGCRHENSSDQGHSRPPGPWRRHRIAASSDFKFEDKDDSASDQNHTVGALSHTRNGKFECDPAPQAPRSYVRTDIWLSQALRCSASSAKGFCLARCPRICFGDLIDKIFDRARIKGTIHCVLRPISGLISWSILCRLKKSI